MLTHISGTTYYQDITQAVPSLMTIDAGHKFQGQFKVMQHFAKGCRDL